MDVSVMRTINHRDILVPGTWTYKRFWPQWKITVENGSSAQTFQNTLRSNLWIAR